MPAKSKSQRRFMGLVYALKKGKVKAHSVSEEVQRAADGMSAKDARDFAKTKHDGLPEKEKKASWLDEFFTRGFLSRIEEECKVSQT